MQVYVKQRGLTRSPADHVLIPEFVEKCRHKKSRQQALGSQEKR
jgi:hypothetical protein